MGKLEGKTAYLVLGTLTERTNNVVAGRKNGAGLARFTERFAKVNGVRLRQEDDGGRHP